MKRSLFIAIAVLIVMALFVGCKAEIADRDELGMVSISGTSRTLSASAELTVDVENLYWYYTAAKADESLFTTGATAEKTAVKAGAGLSGAKLASKFSTGAWTFCFYGYENEYDPANTTQKPVYYQEGLAVTVAKNTTAYLTVTLSQGEGLAAPTLAINEATWSYANAGGETLVLRVFDGDSTTAIVEIEAVASNEGIATFSTQNDYVFTAAGAHTLSFKVYYGTQLVGETAPVELITKNGFKYTITDLSATSAGIETLDETGEVVISGSYNADTGSATAVGSVIATAGENTITATIAPASTTSATETATTTVTFPEGALTADTSYTLDLEVTPAATASSFTVTSGTAVAGINLGLSAGTTEVTQFDTTNGYVTVTTNVGAGLGTVTVEYEGSEYINGTDGEKYLVSYDNDHGTLVFKTSHFSEFVVVSTSAVAINTTTNTAYSNFATAVGALNDGETIVLLKDLDFSTAEYSAYKWAGSTYNPLEITKSNVTLDLGGHTISNMGNVAICFGHLLAADGRIENVTIKNGTLSAGKTDGVTNSYALAIAGADGAKVENVTTLGGINVYTASQDVEIIDCNINGTKYYTVCAQCGSNVTIKGTTYTKNTDNTVANKSMFWIDKAGSDSDLATSENPSGTYDASSITIESGSFTVDTANDGAFYLSSGLKPIVKGGTFNIDPTAYLATGFSATEDNGTWTVSAN